MSDTLNDRAAAAWTAFVGPVDGRNAYRDYFMAGYKKASTERPEEQAVVEAARVQEQFQRETLRTSALMRLVQLLSVELVDSIGGHPAGCGCSTCILTVTARRLRNEVTDTVLAEFVANPAVSRMERRQADAERRES